MKKIAWVEYAKVIATFLIVLQHSISQEWIKSVNNEQWYILNFLFMLTRMGVPIFIMCSGIGMLGKERGIAEIFKNSIWRILKVYTGWMLVYGIFDTYSLWGSGLASPRTVINAILKNILFGRYHTWFLATLIGLYMITPFLFRIVSEQKMMIYYLILSLTFTVFLPYVGYVDGRIKEVLQEVNMHFVVGYSLYYVAGFYLSRIKLSRLMKVLVLVMFGGSVLICFLLSVFLSNEYGQDCQKVYSEFSAFGFTMSISFIMLIRICFANIEFGKAKVMMKIQSCGFGIYLLHPLLLSFIPNEKFLGMAAVGKAVLVWSGSLVFVALAKQVSKCIHLWNR